jgi:hypothetical protein
MSKAKQPLPIPLFSCDGQVCDHISLERLAVLQSLGRIARVVTHPKGYVNRAYLLPMPGEPKPSTLGDYVGTKYSVVEKLEHGHCWKLRKLEGRDEDGVQFSARNAFLQVVADCRVG